MDEQPCITFRLGTESRYYVEAIRLIWRDVGMDTSSGVMPGPYKYVVEYADEPNLHSWKALLDASDNEVDLCVDYRPVDTVKAYAIRLRILKSPQSITPGLVSFTAFGNIVHEG